MTIDFENLPKEIDWFIYTNQFELAVEIQQINMKGFLPTKAKTKLDELTLTVSKAYNIPLDSCLKITIDIVNFEIVKTFISII